MQPNQQDPNTQTGVPQPPAPAPTQPLPYQVPDYLQMDPLAISQPPRSRKKLIIVMTAIFVVLIAAGAAYSYFQLQQKNIEERFYNAFDKALQVKGVEQEYRTTNLDVTIKGNFPAQKQTEGNITYSYKNGTDFKLAGQIVTFGSGSFSALLTKMPSTDLAKSVKADQWYKVGDSDSRKVQLFDTLDLRSQIHMLAVGIPVGNFEQSSRQQIIDYIKTEGIYEIKSSQQKGIGNKKVTIYTVDVSMKKHSRLHKKLNELVKSERPASAVVKDTKRLYLFQVDNETGYITRIDATDSGSPESMTFSYSLQPATIEEPKSDKVAI